MWSFTFDSVNVLTIWWHFVHRDWRVNAVVPKVDFGHWWWLWRNSGWSTLLVFGKLWGSYILNDNIWFWKVMKVHHNPFDWGGTRNGKASRNSKSHPRNRVSLSVIQCPLQFGVPFNCVSFSGHSAKDMISHLDPSGREFRNSALKSWLQHVDPWTKSSVTQNRQDKINGLKQANFAQILN